MTSWRADPDLAARFHPEYPDDLQVMVHDGEPRRTQKGPEACWARITGVHARVWFPNTTREAQPPFTPSNVGWNERPVYWATLLNQPHHLTTIRQGQPLLILAVTGIPHPLQVTEAYLTERVRWAVVPCDRCGADQALDPPTTMARTRFPNTEGSVPVAFSAFCPCGGTMLLMAMTPN
jgi:hypothetical protein